MKNESEQIRKAKQLLMSKGYIITKENDNKGLWGNLPEYNEPTLADIFPKKQNGKRKQ